MVDCGFRFRTTVHFSNRTFEYSSQNCVPYLIVFPQNSSSSKRKKKRMTILYRWSSQPTISVFTISISIILRSSYILYTHDMNTTIIFCLRACDLSLYIHLRAKMRMYQMCVGPWMPIFVRKKKTVVVTLHTHSHTHTYEHKTCKEAVNNKFFVFSLDQRKKYCFLHESR